MRVGSLRFLASIKELVKSQDELGGIKESWQEVAKAWCDIKPISGKEAWYSAEKHAYCTHKITMRYTKNLNIKSIIEVKNRRFEPQEIINLNERDKTLVIVAKESLNEYDKPNN